MKEFNCRTSKNKAVLIKSNDWEGLYVENKLVCEGHIDEMNEGQERALFFAEKADSNYFELKDMVVQYLEDEDIKITENNGGFPDDISYFKGKYV